MIHHPDFKTLEQLGADKAEQAEHDAEVHAALATQRDHASRTRASRLMRAVFHRREKSPAAAVRNPAHDVR